MCDAGRCPITRCERWKGRSAFPLRFRKTHKKNLSTPSSSVSPAKGKKHQAGPGGPHPSKRQLCRGRHVLDRTDATNLRRSAFTARSLSRLNLRVSSIELRAELIF